ncbi:MAG: ribonuclease HII, partial [Acidobacteriota bacterium]
MAAAKGRPGPHESLEEEGGFISQIPLAEIRRRHFLGRTIPERAVRRALAGDPRAGAQALLDLARSRLRRKRRYDLRAQELLRLERRLWRAGVEKIGGVDEAGMGQLAGPVVAAAVILPRDALLP